MSKYNCKVDGDQYRITKFDADFNVEASYFTTLAECDCPAGHRDTCRHRKMLPKFIAKKATRGEMFLNYETERWDKVRSSSLRWLTRRNASMPKGINLLDLADPETVHNAIADAVGEPRITPTKPLRRL